MSITAVIIISLLGIIIIGLVFYVGHLMNREPDERKIYIDSGRIMRDKELEANEEQTVDMPPPSVDDVSAELDRIRARRRKRQ